MMSTTTRNYDKAGADRALTRREEMSVSGSVLSEAPWGLAAGAGAVVTVADVVVHLVTLRFALMGPIELGLVAFFAVAGAGALLRSRRSRAVVWAQTHPWRFAVLPGAACAIIVFVLSMVVDGGLFGSLFSGLWHGAAAFGVTGLVGSVGRPRRARA
jgi:hypothetical protein